MLGRRSPNAFSRPTETQYQMRLFARVHEGVLVTVTLVLSALTKGCSCS